VRYRTQKGRLIYTLRVVRLWLATRTHSMPSSSSYAPRHNHLLAALPLRPWADYSAGPGTTGTPFLRVL
jgi:hypothetical protein